MSVIQILEGLAVEAPQLYAGFESLVKDIMGSKSPSDAQIKAAAAVRGLEMDALEDASDAAVNEILKKAHP